MNGLLAKDGGTGGPPRLRAKRQLPTPSLSPRDGLQVTHAPAESTGIRSDLTTSPRHAGPEALDDHTSATLSGNEKNGSEAWCPTVPKPYTRDRKRSIGKLSSPTISPIDHVEKALKLSPQQMQELASPGFLPVRAATPIPEHSQPLSAPADGVFSKNDSASSSQDTGEEDRGRATRPHERTSASKESNGKADIWLGKTNRPSAFSRSISMKHSGPARTASNPPFVKRRHSSSKVTGLQEISSIQMKAISNAPPPLDLRDTAFSYSNGGANLKPSPLPDARLSPMVELPLPTLSLPLFLQLELAADGPSPLYIHRSAAADRQFESSAVTFERLQNFLELPFRLEQSLWFGAVACLDAWLHIFTILPLRFLTALRILGEWWSKNAWNEGHALVDFVYHGCGRLWIRWKGGKKDFSRHLGGNESSRSSRGVITPPSRPPDRRQNGTVHANPELPKKHRRISHRHRRTRSTPSLLKSSHKADLLKGLLLVLTCSFLMWLDPSRMYHGIRGQAAIKLYVIYNVLEVADRMLGAIGQDILECLFSRECLDRGSDGRSKLIRPFWMFILALIYNVAHASALFYQTITLNVAVNSYSNALLTLLMSNQFVEIKGTVFKRFEKENLFQMACADIVERFQLWLMLLIIAIRNIVEVGGLNVSPNSSLSGSSAPGATSTGIPISSGNILPKSFTILPHWVGQVVGPFLVVLGSEMLVDWLKHAFITKFNNVKPNIYGRFYDVLAKDYYTHAFADQDLTKRLGLPTLPLAALFIRACIQTYHMFLAIHMPLPLPSSATAVSVESSTASSTPATTSALQHIDDIFRRALGRSSFGAAGNTTEGGFFNPANWSIDDLIAISTMLVVFLIAYLILLVAKLLLGMLLLAIARARYKRMKERANIKTDVHGKRVGGWGVVEVDEEKRRWIYRDDEQGLDRLKERDLRANKERERGLNIDKLERVKRYDMVAKRIW